MVDPTILLNHRNATDKNELNAILKMFYSKLITNNHLLLTTDH
jgi:hypothetical protein